jgi:[FeFe] hydrogenase H-cluster maturation GTPase HydF
VLVMPQDKQAPKGRLILPQVQVIRELLDRKALAVAVSDAELPQALAALRRKPDLVITDSQVFGKVSQMLDEDVPLTSFSILFARNKGDVAVFREGAEAIDDLRPGDTVLIAEACTHHPVKGDISREKLPNWLMERAGGPLSIHVQAGNDFPDDLSRYRLIIHCGACMTNRKQVLSRISRAKEAGVPITNHGMAIAKMTGILDRAMGPLESMRL